MENVHKHHPVTRAVLLQQMKAWLEGTENESIITDLHNEEYEDEIHDAIKEQNTIGWDNFFKGRIISKWSAIQQKVYSKINAERKCNPTIEDIFRTVLGSETHKTSSVL